MTVSASLCLGPQMGRLGNWGLAIWRHLHSQVWWWTQLSVGIFPSVLSFFIIYGGFEIAGLLTWKLRPPKWVSQWIRQAESLFMIWLEKSCVHFHCILCVISELKTHPDSRVGSTGSTSQWEKYQRIWGHLFETTTTIIKGADKSEWWRKNLNLDNQGFPFYFYHLLDN